MSCEDCQNDFKDNEGAYYKYEPHTWLCDDCLTDRMEEE